MLLYVVLYVCMFWGLGNEALPHVDVQHACTTKGSLSQPGVCCRHATHQFFPPPCTPSPECCRDHNPFTVGKLQVGFNGTQGRATEAGGHNGVAWWPARLAHRLSNSICRGLSSVRSLMMQRERHLTSALLRQQLLGKPGGLKAVFEDAPGNEA